MAVAVGALPPRQPLHNKAAINPLTQSTEDVYKIGIG